MVNKTVAEQVRSAYTAPLAVAGPMGAVGVEKPGAPMGDEKTKA